MRDDTKVVYGIQCFDPLYRGHQLSNLPVGHIQAFGAESVYGINELLLRLSVEIEEAENLIEDLEQALKS